MPSIRKIDLGYRSRNSAQVRKRRERIFGKRVFPKRIRKLTTPMVNCPTTAKTDTHDDIDSDDEFDAEITLTFGEDSADEEKSEMSQVSGLQVPTANPVNLLLWEGKLYMITQGPIPDKVVIQAPSTQPSAAVQPGSSPEVASTSDTSTGTVESAPWMYDPSLVLEEESAEEHSDEAKSPEPEPAPNLKAEPYCQPAITVDSAEEEDAPDNGLGDHASFGSSSSPAEEALDVQYFSVSPEDPETPPPSLDYFSPSTSADNSLYVTPGAQPAGTYHIQDFTQTQSGSNSSLPQSPSPWALDRVRIGRRRRGRLTEEEKEIAARLLVSANLPWWRRGRFTNDIPPPPPPRIPKPLEPIRRKPPLPRSRIGSKPMRIAPKPTPIAPKPQIPPPQYTGIAPSSTSPTNVVTVLGGGQNMSLVLETGAEIPPTYVVIPTPASYSVMQNTKDDSATTVPHTATANTVSPGSDCSAIGQVEYSDDVQPGISYCDETIPISDVGSRMWQRMSPTTRSTYENVLMGASKRGNGCQSREPIGKIVHSVLLKPDQVVDEVTTWDSDSDTEPDHASQQPVRMHPYRACVEAERRRKQPYTPCVAIDTRRSRKQPRCVEEDILRRLLRKGRGGRYRLATDDSSDADGISDDATTASPSQDEQPFSQKVLDTSATKLKLSQADYMGKINSAMYAQLHGQSAVDLMESESSVEPSAAASSSLLCAVTSPADSDNDLTSDPASPLKYEEAVLI